MASLEIPPGKPSKSKLRNLQSSLPHHQRELGLILFLGSLAVFFVSCLLAYILIRITVDHPPEARYANLPPILWFSTLVLVVGSSLLVQSVNAVKRQKLPKFKFLLFTATCIAILFCALQSIGMNQLLEEHWNTSKLNGLKPYGLILTFVVLHCLHFIGGLGFLAYVNWKAYRDRYDHEYYSGVRIAAVYWRFLDVVWLCMLAMFYFTP